MVYCVSICSVISEYLLAASKQVTIFRNSYLYPSIFPGMRTRPPSRDLAVRYLGLACGHQQGAPGAKVETHHHSWEQ